MAIKIGPGVIINPSKSGVSGATNSIVINPTPLGSPTITSVTTASTSSVTVSFSAPASTGGIPITKYTVISNPCNITISSSNSPVTVTGLTSGQTYTFTVSAQNSFGSGPAGASSNSIKLPSRVASSSTSFTVPGTYCWYAPTCTSVSVVAVGGGGGGYAQRSGLWGSGGGAGLGYINNYAVTSGTNYRVVVGAGGVGAPICLNYPCHSSDGGNSYFVNTSIVMGGSGPGWYSAYTQNSVFVGCGGSHGGAGMGSGGGHNSGGGGGAAGYTGCGGGGGWNSTLGNASPGFGGGGGGGYAYSGGGGVGIFGQGTNGIAGSCNGIRGGGGGSGGSTGSTAYGILYPGCKSLVGNGGAYGGGGGGPIICGGTTGGYPQSTSGGNGAVRIVWPGDIRKFPSTCVSTP